MTGRILAAALLLAPAAGPSAPALYQRIARLEAIVATLQAESKELRSHIPQDIPGCFPYRLDTHAGAIECRVCQLASEDK